MVSSQRSCCPCLSHGGRVGGECIEIILAADGALDMPCAIPVHSSLDSNIGIPDRRPAKLLFRLCRIESEESCLVRMRALVHFDVEIRPVGVGARDEGLDREVRMLSWTKIPC